MATLLSIASGNFTDSSTWGLVDTTSYLNSEAGNALLTTASVKTSAFLPGAITIAGIAVKINSYTTTPTNINLTLFQLSPNCL